MEYQTRKLMALKEFRHMGADLIPGVKFDATVADARYLTKHGKAEYAPDAFAEPTPAAKSVPAPAAKPAAASVAPVQPRPTLNLSKDKDEKKPDEKKAEEKPFVAPEKKDDVVLAPRPIVSEKPEAGATSPLSTDDVVIARRPLN